MRTHIKVISVIDVILGALTFLGGAALLIVSLGAAGQATATTAGVIGGAFGGLLIMTVGVLGIVVGIKLGEYRNWARVTQIIFGAFQLINFPLGTIFGVYSLWAMLSRDGQALFMEQPEEERKLRRAA